MAGTERSRRFTYNSKDQQLKVDCEDGRSQENLYDAEGLRYGVKDDGISTRFVYYQGELLYEGSDGKEVSYYLGSGIEAAQIGGEIYYYYQDEQLSTALLTDHVGKVRNHYRYSAFGEMLEGSESVGNRIRYTGQQYDEISGQYYLRARYYNPVVGRFLQEDVYQEDGLNLYAYCGNNPVKYYDPSGYTSYEFGELAGEGSEKFQEQSSDSNGNSKSGSIVYDELDSLRRATGIEATIDSTMIGTGTKANSSIYPPGFEGGGPGSAGHARGHLLGKQLGGSGDDPRNLVTLYQNPVNSPIMRDYETSVRTVVENGEAVNYKVTPIYKGDDLVPMGITIQAKGTGDFSLYVTILNRKNKK